MYIIMLVPISVEVKLVLWNILVPTYNEKGSFVYIRTLTGPAWHSSFENVVAIDLLCRDIGLVTYSQTQIAAFKRNHHGLICNLHPVVRLHQLGDRYCVCLFGHELREVKFQRRVGVAPVQGVAAIQVQGCIVLRFGVIVLQVQLHRIITM